MQYLDNLFGFEWVQTKSPAGAIQWMPKDAGAKLVPDAHDPTKFTRRSCSRPTWR
jgi:catalase-peroxidase